MDSIQISLSGSLSEQNTYIQEMPLSSEYRIKINATDLKQEQKSPIKQQENQQKQKSGLVDVQQENQYIKEKKQQQEKVDEDDNFQQLIIDDEEEKQKASENQQNNQCNNRIQQQMKKIVSEKDSVKDQGNVKSLSVKLDDYYEVVLEDDLQQIYSTRDQWKQFIAQRISAENPTKVQMNVKDLNSLIRLFGTDSCIRKFLWRTVLKKVNANQNKIKMMKTANQGAQFVSEQINVEQPEGEQMKKNIVSKVSEICEGYKYNTSFIKSQLSILEKKMIKEIQKNVRRLLQKWKQNKSVQQNLKKVFQYSNNDNNGSDKDESQGNQRIIKTLSDIICNIIIEYCLQDEQINNPKGMEYILFSIMFVSPFGPFIESSKEYFQYFLTKLNFKSLYYSGQPIFYKQQLPNLLQQLRGQVPDLYTKVQKMNPDWGKLFISYYKSLLTYKLKDFILIAKFYDLFLIYGIRIVRIILARILKKEEKSILIHFSQGKELLAYLGTQIIANYFDFNMENYEIDKETHEKEINDKIYQLIFQVN